MYLARLHIKNFRILKDVNLPLQRGLNVLLGENDSGKSAIIDAIRLLLGTRDYERNQITIDDFFVDQNGRSKEFSIEAEFKGINDEEAALFLEWITIESTNTDGSLNYVLQMRLLANRKEQIEIVNNYDREIRSTLTAGPVSGGTQLTQETRDFLRATYLKPLRDAEQELAARRGSRLSQILLYHPVVRQQDTNADDAIPGIVRRANDEVKNHPSIASPIKTLNEDYLANFTLGSTSIQASVDMSNPSLRTILEHLELTLTDGIPNVDTQHGLGLNNLLFMATELLLLQSANSPAPLVMIEEPEAHLHPQFQLRLMYFLKQQAEQNATRQVQVIMTSHSSNLASQASLKNILLIRNGRAFSLDAEYTKLEDSDYRFLQNFLDVTKSNLFFARGVFIVEGDAEQLLLPVIARLIGKSLEKFGLTIVNVGHVGLFRYARIFQRKDNSLMGIHVACLTDLDVPSPEAKEYLHRNKNGNQPKTHAELSQKQIEYLQNKKKSRASGGDVATYVSPCWTLEHDLCWNNERLAIPLRQAILLGSAADAKSGDLTLQQIAAIKIKAENDVLRWKANGLNQAQLSAKIYEPLYSGRASKVTTAHFLCKLLDENFSLLDPQENRSLFPQYIVEAIDYVTTP